MKTIAEKAWSYVLFEADYGWVLTFLTGGPIEVGVSVLLNNDEIAQIKSDPSCIDALVEEFSRDRAAIADRRITPPVWK